MMNQVLASVNTVLRRAGLVMVPAWRLDALSGTPSFEVRGRRVNAFVHTYQCGFPPARLTERCLELAVADWWLDQDAVARERLIEIGAVTPYYWPHRVPRVVDPFDTHPRVTSRQSLFAEDLRGLDVLSISTLEHIGLGEYGPTGSDETVAGAFDKIHREANRFLITVPYGFNPEADRVFFGDTPLPSDARATFMVRSATGNDWVQVGSGPDARRPYGRGLRHARWANGLAIVERGGLL